MTCGARRGATGLPLMLAWPMSQIPGGSRPKNDFNDENLGRFRPVVKWQRPANPGTRNTRRSDSKRSACPQRHNRQDRKP